MWPPMYPVASAQVRDSTGAVVCTLDNDESMLGAYAVEDNMELQVSSLPPFRSLSPAFPAVVCCCMVYFVAVS